MAARARRKKPTDAARQEQGTLGREVVGLPEIKCTVNQCFFWKDDWCGASAIEVAPRQGTRSAYFEAGTIGEPAVERSTETQCVTFRPRGTAERQPARREEPAAARRGNEAGRRPPSER